MLQWFFDFSTGFRFSKISVECSVHICSCPWLNIPNEKLVNSTSVHCAVSESYILPLNNLNCRYKAHILNPYKLDQLDIHDFADIPNHKVHQYKDLKIRNLNRLSKFLRSKYHRCISYPKRLVKERASGCILLTMKSTCQNTCFFEKRPEQI